MGAVHDHVTMCLILSRLLNGTNLHYLVAASVHRCPLPLHVRRRQQTLQNATQSFKSLAATQQQMEELSSRLAMCLSAIAAARNEMETSRAAGKG